MALKLHCIKKLTTPLLLLFCLLFSQYSYTQCVEYSQVLSIFDASCMNGCHANGVGGTSLTYDELVNGTSAACGGVPYVVVGDADASYLYDKINDDGSVQCGSAMPFGPALPQAEQDLIAAWINGGAIETAINGCTDPNATNYDATANCDDGSCSLAVSGCTDPCAPNYDATATADDGSCQAYDTSCPDVNCSTFAWDANSCSCLETSTPDTTCDDADACTTDSYDFATCSCVNEPIVNCGETLGCTDPCAPNYDAAATLDDGSCQAYDTSCPDVNCATFAWDANSCSCLETSTPDTTCDDADACTTDSYDFATCSCVNEPIVNCGETLGCTDPCAPNYNAAATLDDGTCQAYQVNCDDNNPCTVDSFDAQNCTCVNAPIANCGTNTSNNVPTLSEWGLILFILLLMNLGLLTTINQYVPVWQTQNQSVKINSYKWKNLNIPFSKDLFKKALNIGLVMILIGFAFSLLFFGVITSVDFICSFICLPIFAYLLHLVLMAQK